MAGRQGLEPRYADPESAVLPLDDLPRITSTLTKRRHRLQLIACATAWRNAAGTAPTNLPGRERRIYPSRNCGIRGSFVARDLPVAWKARRHRSPDRGS